MPGKCTLNPSWFEMIQYKNWIQGTTNKHKVKCSLCHKDIDISNMGEAALTSHAKSEKHKKLMLMSTRTIKISDCFSEKSQSSPSNTVSSSSVKQYVSGNEVLTAEIYWSLKVVQSHYSFKSSENAVPVFELMFPDSEIARKMSCGERKCAYLSSFGIGPYFLSLIKERVKSEENYVLLFDESLNLQLQKKQLDLQVRYWEGNQVTSRFYNSVFMGHATAEDLFEQLHLVCGNLGFRNLLQISMDGPSVNWKVFNMMTDEVEKETHKKLLNIGSCGLHIIHNSFRAGHTASGWEVDNWLSSMHWLFSDSPARREDFERITGSQQFPLKFCKHRWLENIPVAERALAVWPFVKEYILAAKSGKAKEPQNKSFKTLDNFMKDPLLEAKVHAFLSIAKVVTPFLTIYQSDMPLLPFLATDLYKMVRELMLRFVKTTVMDSVTSAANVLLVDIKDNSSYLHPAQIDVGFVVNNLLTIAKTKKRVSEKEILSFQLEVRAFLSSVVKKILEKSPLKHGLVRNLQWLSPSFIVQDRNNSFKQLQRTLRILADAKLIDISDCDQILSEFRAFIEDILSSDSCQCFMKFDHRQMVMLQQERLDVLLYGHLKGKPQYSKLWEVARMLLILSHGQASVERGFSENKEIMVHNMSEKCLISQRAIVDHLNHVGGIKNVQITQKLLLAAAGARQAYHAHLDQCNKKKESSLLAQKRKCLVEEIEDIKKKKRRFEKDVIALQKSATDSAEKAERTGQITLISKSNALRRAAIAKESALTEINSLIQKKLHELAN